MGRARQGWSSVLGLNRRAAAHRQHSPRAPRGLTRGSTPPAAAKVFSKVSIYRRPEASAAQPAPNGSSGREGWGREGERLNSWAGHTARSQAALTMKLNSAPAPPSILVTVSPVRVGMESRPPDAALSTEMWGDCFLPAAIVSLTCRVGVHGRGPGRLEVLPIAIVDAPAEAQSDAQSEAQSEAHTTRRCWGCIHRLP